MSNATVKKPLLAISKPGMLSVIISRSSEVIIIGSSPFSTKFLFKRYSPCSTFSIKALSNFSISFAAHFIFAPNFLPNVLKLAFAFFRIKLLLASKISTSLIFVSVLIISSINWMFFNISLSRAGMKTFCKGCLTFIFTFFLIDKIKEEAS